MIKVLYFARIKESLGIGEESLPFSEAIATTNDLLQFLIARDAAWKETLLDNKVLIAVNQEICNSNQNLKSGDEVAFFPPVTGG